MTHLWVRAESRANEERVGITPEGVRALCAQGITITVEESPTRVLPDAGFAAAGATLAATGSWPDAPREAIIFGLKELPEDGTPLIHRHIMFGHAFKGQPAGQILLQRFKAGGGVLLDLEYLTDDAGRRLAAFGYWAGYAGAAVTLSAWAAQVLGQKLGPVSTCKSAEHMLGEVNAALGRAGSHRPNALVVGALGRVGTGVRDLCAAADVAVTAWDLAETASGGPFPEVLAHDLFFNCVLAAPGTPVFVPKSALTAPRRLSLIGDIACDPDSDFSPIKVYNRATTWAEPTMRVAEDPGLEVMAIDNLPSLLPAESSADFAAQLLPVLLNLPKVNDPVWSRAEQIFRAHLARV